MLFGTENCFGYTHDNLAGVQLFTRRQWRQRGIFVSVSLCCYQLALLFDNSLLGYRGLDLLAVNLAR